MSVCPRCGNKYAYVGFAAVECPNEECENFCQSQVLPAAIAEAADRYRPPSDSLGVGSDWSIPGYLMDTSEISINIGSLDLN